MEQTAIRKVISTTVKEGSRDRVLEFIGTTEGVDRDGERIKAGAWVTDKYVKNPVVQWAHNYSEPPIGKTLSIRQNRKKETIFEIEFADKETYDFADTIFKLCKGGFLSATSVGFIPLEFDKAQKEGDPARTFTKVELLEISIVPVPSNPEALITARDAGVISMKEFNLVANKPEDKPIIESKADVSMPKTVTEAININKVEIHQPAVSSQDELKDELEFTLSLVKTVGLSKEVQPIALELVSEIRRLTGSDKPADIKDDGRENMPAEIPIRLTPIQTMLEPVIKSLTEHHLAHMKCNDDVMKMLGDMCAGNEPDPEMEEAQLRRLVIEQTIKEIQRRKS